MPATEQRRSPYLKLRLVEVLSDSLEDGADDEDVVEDGEAGEAAVEDGAHLPGEQDGDGHRVGQEAQRPQHDLQGCNSIDIWDLRLVLGQGLRTRLGRRWIG